MSDIHYIKTEKLDDFIRILGKKYAVLTPAAQQTKDTDYSYTTRAESEQLLWNSYRVIEPLKTLLNHPRESVASYFTHAQEEDAHRTTVVFGVKNCDITSLKLQDYVFLSGGTEDELYRLRRQNTIFISGDCTSFKEVCFCMALDILPYPTQGFDLNLSPQNDGYLVEVGSEKGAQLLEESKDLFSPAKDTQLSARKAKRENLMERLREHLSRQQLPARNQLQALVRGGYSADTWQQSMLTCVECGGCNFICPMCHCFLLSDRQKPAGNDRIRLWDSCQYANYARVAGGANPLKRRTQRFRYRFTKKFDFFVDNLQMPGCTGCGRCIEVCPGKIDLREVLKSLAKNAAVGTR